MKIISLGFRYIRQSKTEKVPTIYFVRDSCTFPLQREAVFYAAFFGGWGDVDQGEGC